MCLVVDERLRLEPLDPGEHAVELFGLVELNRARLREWLPWLDDNRNVEDTMAFLERAWTLERLVGGLIRGIRLDERLVGVVGFNTIDAANRSAEMGYWIDRDHTGRGIVTTAARRLARHGFEDLRLHRISIPVETRNRASRAVAERLGARAEGVRRDGIWLYDRFVDLVVYGLLEDELRSA